MYFYIVKLGYAGVNLFFLIFALKHRLWVFVMCTRNYVLSKIKKNYKLSIEIMYMYKNFLCIAWACFHDFVNSLKHSRCYGHGLEICNGLGYNLQFISV